MAVQRRVNWISQGRVDVPDVRAVESAASNDFDQLIQSFVTGTTQGYVLRGFEILMTGAIGGAASGLQMLVDPGALFHIAASQSGTVLMTPAGTAPQQLNSATNTIVDGAFTPNAINYVGVDYERFIDSSTDAQVYLWDPTTNSETTKVAPRAQILRFRLKVSTTVWPTNILPIAVVTTDAGNNVLSITDARWSLFRLGTGGASPNPFYVYPWTAQTEGRVENPSTSSSNSVNPFHGGDKMLANLKDWMNAIMSDLLEIKGTTYWYSTNSAGSLVSLREDLASTVTTGRGTITHSPTTAGLINWSDDIFLKIIGSNLSYKFAANPSSTDIQLADNEVAYITLTRNVSISPNLIFTNGSKIVQSVGSVSWTSNLQSGDWIRLGSDTTANYYQIDTVDSVSQVTLLLNYAGVSTGASGAKSVYAYGTYNASVSPSTSRDIFIVDRSLVPSGQDIFWFLFRADNGGVVPRVYVRFIGQELEQGDTDDIDDGVPRQLLAYIGSPMESASRPIYTSAFNPSISYLANVTNLAFGASSGGITGISGGQYFYVNSSNNARQYYVWFKVSGVGSDPAPAANRIGIQVNITTGQTNAQVATAVASALGSTNAGDFTAVTQANPNQYQVTVTNTSAGTCIASSNGDVSGLTVTTPQAGTGPGNNIIHDGDNLTLAIKELDQAFGSLLVSLDDPSYDEALSIVTGGSGVLIEQITDFSSKPESFTTFFFSTNFRRGFYFLSPATTTVTDVTFKLGADPAGGSFAPGMTAYMYNDSAGSPGTIIGSSPLNSSTVPTSATDFNFVFSSPVAVTSGQRYYIVLGIASITGIQELDFYGRTSLPDAQLNAGLVTTNDLVSWTVGSSSNGNDVYFIVNSTGGGAGPGQIVGPISSGTDITLPNNSRLANVAQFYTVGKGSLQIFLNGQYLHLSDDWAEVGASGTASNSIQIERNLVVGDLIEFRISAGGASAGGGGGVGPAGPAGPAGPPGADAAGGPIAISTKTANYTILLTDCFLKANCAVTPQDITFTLPPASTCAGRIFYFKKIDSTSHIMTIQANGAELIDGFNTKSTSSLNVSFSLVCDGTTWSLF